MKALQLRPMALGIAALIIGAIIAILVGIVIIGGIKKIGRVSERLVPAMIVFYICATLIIILEKIHPIPAYTDSRLSPVKSSS